MWGNTRAGSTPVDRNWCVSLAVPGHPMQIAIKAKSSGEEPYDVRFDVTGDVLVVTCDCNAGVFGKLCKHKTELIAGDHDRLYDPSDTSQLDAVAAIVARAPGIAEVAAEIAETERLIRVAQAKNKQVKKKFEDMLKNGLPLDPE